MWFYAMSADNTHLVLTDDYDPIEIARGVHIRNLERDVVNMSRPVFVYDENGVLVHTFKTK